MGSGHSGPRSVGVAGRQEGVCAGLCLHLGLTRIWVFCMFSSYGWFFFFLNGTFKVSLFPPTNHFLPNKFTCNDYKFCTGKNVEMLLKRFHVLGKGRRSRIHFLSEDRCRDSVSNVTPRRPLARLGPGSSPLCRFRLGHGHVRPRPVLQIMKTLVTAQPSSRFDIHDKTVLKLSSLPIFSI